MVSTQGGVLPKWLQGSSVTYIVAPRAAFTGPVEGHYLGVRFSGPRMPALAHDLAIARDHGPHQGVRRNRIAPALGEAAGKIHHRIPQHVFLSPIRTLTVGAGLRLENEPSPAQPPKRLAGSPNG